MKTDRTGAVSGNRKLVEELSAIIPTLPEADRVHALSIVQIAAQAALRNEAEQSEQFLKPLSAMSLQSRKVIRDTISPMLLDWKTSVDRDITDIKGLIAEKTGQADRIERIIAAGDEIRPWLDGPFRLDRIDGSAWHKVCDAYASGELLAYSETPLPEDLRGTPTIVPAHVFLVQHDWAAAFDGAGDFAGGEYRFPYDHTVFEMVVTGKRVAADFLAFEDDGAMLTINVQTKHGWFILACFSRKPGGSEWLFRDSVPSSDNVAYKLAAFITSQAKAICVALEAEVATADVIRAPAKLNAARARRGARPISDHHVVNLARRFRRPTPLDEHHQTGRRVRLHFRRGHWRHYPSHRTWINWMLVGDPDLGFIEKHYKA